MAVLWLKVDNEDVQMHDGAADTGKNVTIWLFNVKQPQWDETVKCSSSYPEHRTREISGTADCLSSKLNPMKHYWDDDSQEIHLDEKVNDWFRA